MVMTWVIDLFAASSSVLPMLTCTGFTSKSPAILRTSFGHVAVYMRVCLREGISFTILRICGSNPMSSIRSASSSTKYVTCLKLTFLTSKKSFSRPGVAITMSAPLSMSLNWGAFGAPPYTHCTKSMEGFEKSQNTHTNQMTFSCFKVEYIKSISEMFNKAQFLTQISLS
jgi:hypothetical protein